MSSPLSQPHVEATVGKRSVAVDFMRIVAIMAVFVYMHYRYRF